MNTSVALGFGNGGWVEYSAGDLDHPIYMRFRLADDGRLELADLFVPFESSPRVTDLRDLSDRIAFVDATVNKPDARDYLVGQLNSPAPDLRMAASHYSTTFGEREPDHWVKLMMASQRRGTDLPKPRRPRRGPAGKVRQEDRPLTVAIPMSKPYPDEFYEAVASAYSSAAARTHRPAAEIAEVNDVAIKTVHGWIAEARRRGHLAPGRKGRAG